MSARDRSLFRRQILQIEYDVLVKRVPTSAAEIETALSAAAAPLGEPAQKRVRALSRAAADATTRAAYLDQHGCVGVTRFATRGEATIYMMTAETFPDHINNLYLVIERTAARSGGRTLTLFDAGSQFNQSLLDLTRAREVLDVVYGPRGDGAILSEVRDVVISHGHIDHFGGVRDWQAQGARVHVHPFDLRVLTRFDERVVEAGVHLRGFLREAGCAPEVTRDLLAMNLFAKRAFQSVPVDRELADGEAVNGWQVTHVPGHCPGQVMLTVDHVLLTADHLLSRITPHQSPESITPWTGLDHYLLSLGKTAALLQEQHIDLCLGGHEKPMHDPMARVEEIARFHKGRLTIVRDLCQEEQTISQIALAMFGSRPDYGQLLALEETAAHVEYLVKRGRLAIANIDDLIHGENRAIRYQKA